MEKQFLYKRLHELGWTLYYLTKKVCEMRAGEGKVPPVTRYQSGVSKAIANPAKSKLETIEELVKALEGELTIQWTGAGELPEVCNGHEK